MPIQQLEENAANSLQWSARASLALGNSSSALAYLREALAILAFRDDPFYRRNCYATASDVFNSMRVYDSALYYQKKHQRLNDSLEHIVALSSIRIVRLRANEETNRQNIQSLQREKSRQLWLRNLLIAGIVLLALVGLLLYNRQQIKNRLKLERLEQERRQVMQEMETAKEQLTQFTNYIVEKTALAEKLEAQLLHKELTAEQQELMTELSQQTLLTEEDWNRFKALFQKIYPSFFNNLKEKAPGITIAEQRMAALTRMQLTSRQIASMLGISVDSVHKTRQRLRQRFLLSTETNMEEFLAQL